jgi:hypothetical protein
MLSLTPPRHISILPIRAIRSLATKVSSGSGRRVRAIRLNEITAFERLHFPAVLFGRYVTSSRGGRAPDRGAHIDRRESGSAGWRATIAADFAPASGDSRIAGGTAFSPACPSVPRLWRLWRRLGPR